MAAILFLEDGRDVRSSTLGMGGALALIAERIDDSHHRLKRWLADKAKRGAPFLDFDMRALSPENRTEFWRAAGRAFDALKEEFGPDFLDRENAFSANSLNKLLVQHSKILAGEPPQEVYPYFDGFCDLDDIWFEDAEE